MTFAIRKKNGNVVPIHKKDNFWKTYCPVFLLPVYGKILELLKFNGKWSNFTKSVRFYT